MEHNMISAKKLPVTPRLSDFLAAFFPDEDEPIHFRALPPKGGQGASVKIQTSRRELASSQSLQQKLRDLNKTHGIYFVVNAGGDVDSHIHRFNAVFCESDDQPIPL